MRVVYALAVAVLLGPAPGWAGLEICNDSDVRQSVAIGYKSDETWMSEGWWNISPGNCVEPVEGDLKQRYYYVQAKAAGWVFEHERIAFCTTSRAFTIEGDEDCAGRGFDKGYFRKIDTGKTARHFTVELAAFMRPDPTEPAERGYTSRSTEDKAAAPPPVQPPTATPPAATPPPAAQPPAAPAGFAPGTHGDPWEGRGIIQGCDIIDGYDHCSFYADGMKFMVPREDGPSEPGARNVLTTLDPGTPVRAEGDIVDFFDASVEFAISRIAVAKLIENDVLMRDLQGAWYAVDDPASQVTILGSERFWTYDGADSMFDTFRIANQCDGRSGGPYIVSTDPEMGDTLCYSIERLDRQSIVLMYVGSGNFLEYRRLD